MFTNAILYYGLHTSSVGTVKTYAKYYRMLAKGENNKLLGVFPVNKLFHFLYIKKAHITVCTLQSLINKYDKRPQAKTLLVA